jgi:ABC-type branched-subunit amino acid transport system ATPase component
MTTTATRPKAATPALEADGLSVSYGGNLAVDRVSLSAAVGEVTGLIGPNGAGKTSTFNACNGLVRPSAGTVTLFGADVTRRSPADRARRGLGRTFQRVEVCRTMTARDNVALGVEARLAGPNGVRHVWASATERRRIAEATDDALVMCGIAHLADRLASSLSTGHLRLLELARVVAGGFRMLLLDEPSAGLDDEETVRFGDVLTDIVRERGVGVLLVEHDMDLVMSICDRVFVLDFGRLVFDGTTTEVATSSVVRAAYLGDDFESAATS